MTVRTFIIIKPDAVAAGHIGDILARYEHAGLGVVAAEMRHITPEFADRHYSAHIGRDYYPALREFMTSGPLVAVALEGEDAIVVARELNGATDPSKAAPGTIRADFAESTRRNAVHAADSPGSAASEIELWFPGL